jgi:hypothetical protein
MSHLLIEEHKSVSGKTIVAKIISATDSVVLGYVQWSGRWRQYVYCPRTEVEVQWSWECLDELKNYIIELNNKQRKKK